MVHIISIEDVPSRGKLVLTVYFKGYKDSYQNDARRKLLDMPKIKNVKDLDINLTPLEFNIIRMGSDLVKRGIGVSYQYKFRNMDSKKFKNFSETIQEVGKSLTWWGRETILLNTENVPYSGILNFTVYFNDYKDYRKKEVKMDTKNLINEILILDKEENLDIKLRVTENSIVRMILGGISRIAGVSYRLKFTKMDEDKFNSLINIIKSKKDSYEWWNRESISLLDHVGGIYDA